MHVHIPITNHFVYTSDNYFSGVSSLLFLLCAFAYSAALRETYCVRAILTCAPARVLVTGAEVAILGSTRFCSK